MRVLLKHGADVDVANMVTGQTALHLAAKDGDVPLITLLLSEGAHVSSKGYFGETPLHVSLLWSFHPITTIPLDSKVNLMERFWATNVS